MVQSYARSVSRQLLNCLMVNDRSHRIYGNLFQVVGPQTRKAAGSVGRGFSPGSWHQDAASCGAKVRPASVHTHTQKHISATYCGPSLFIHLYITMHNLYGILCTTGSQWSSIRLVSVIWSYFLILVTTSAAALTIICSACRYLAQTRLKALLQ